MAAVILEVSCGFFLVFMCLEPSSRGKAGSLGVSERGVLNLFALHTQLMQQYVLTSDQYVGSLELRAI
jgi:hypothetical protein